MGIERTDFQEGGGWLNRAFMAKQKTKVELI